jgi:tungstate transport system substrate-binding protein
MPRRFMLCLGTFAFACGGRHPAERIRFGTTTTVRQSGLLAVAESLWTGAPLAVVIAPSGQILQSAERGDLAVILTHAPALEARFLGGRTAAARCPFVISRFAIVGPPADPAGVATAASAPEAFARIATRGARFVSRGDSSGTHERELAIWRATGITPAGHAWYVESGADQTTTLRLADERDAYALADLPTLATLPDLGVRPLFRADTLLVNRYTLTLLSSAIGEPSAVRFYDWAIATWRPAALAIRLRDGTPAFEASPGPCPGASTSSPSTSSR